MIVSELVADLKCAAQLTLGERSAIAKMEAEVG